MLSNTYLVNQLGDAGTGTTTASGGSGDIRFAVNEANSHPGSTITFDPKALFGTSGAGTIVLTQGELEISRNTTITNSAGASSVTISGGNTSRVFNITSLQATVSISGLTITDGNGSPLPSTTPGSQGGDIFNGGNLTLSGDVIEKGLAEGTGAQGGTQALGGGIFNAGNQSGGAGATLILDNTLVENNEAEGQVGNTADFPGQPGLVGGFGAGGGVYNDQNASLTVQNGSQIIGNLALGGNGGNGITGNPGKNATAKGPGGGGQNGGDGGGAGAGLGGGIFNNIGGTLSIILGTGSASNVFTDNIAQGGVGGSAGNGGNGGNGSGTGAGGRGGQGGKAGNGGSGSGGGLYSLGSILQLQNSQFQGNQAKGGAGGVVGAGGTGGNGGVSGNAGTGGAAGSGGNGGNAVGGAIYSSAGTLTVAQSTFAADKSGTGNQALAGSGTVGGAGAPGGKGGSTKGDAGRGGPGGGGGNGGAAQGGAVYNAGGDVTFTTVTFTASTAQGGNAATGGAGANGVNGTNGAGGSGGFGNEGGAGGAAQGGAVYNAAGKLNFSTVTFTTSLAQGGKGGDGGAAGTGGTGGTSSTRSFGGDAGSGGEGGIGGAAQGGAVNNAGGDVSFTAVTNTASLAQGGDGGRGINGAAGGTGGKGGGGGFGGFGGGGNAGGAAQGGGVFNQGGNLSFNSYVSTNSQAKGGNGNVGGNASDGANAGTGTSKGKVGRGGGGGDGGSGGAGGAAQGGGFFNVGGTLTVSSSQFTADSSGLGNIAMSGSGANAGSGGNGANGGNASGSNNPGGGGGGGGAGGSGGGAGLAEGGAGYNGGGNATITGSTFTNDSVETGNGGNAGNAGSGGNGGSASGGGSTSAGGSAGSGGQGGSGSIANGGAISATKGSLNISTSNFGGSATLANQVIGGSGGAGGAGGSIGAQGDGAYLVFQPPVNNGGPGGQGGAGTTVSGGAIAAYLTGQPVTISTSTIDDNTINGGVGGAGGQGGALPTLALGILGFTPIGGSCAPGGSGGAASGGGVFLSATSAQTATLSNLDVSGNSATGGMGGAGASIDYSDSSNGGDGGTIQGAGVSSVNYNLTVSNATTNANVGTGGTGGKGGSYTAKITLSAAGGNAGGGGSVLGGGIAFVNNQSSPLTFSITNSTAQNNQLTGGQGGTGGGAGGWGHDHILGGSGGVGGSVQGGGIYIDAGNGSVNTSTLTGLSLLSEQLNGGSGGFGGAGSSTPFGVVAGSFAAGGGGGNAEGGSVYNASSNSATVSTLNITGSTMAGNQLNGGGGGLGATGTTTNGGPGGDGGNGGNAEGGGLFEGDNTILNVINSTIGGTSNSSANYSNTLTGGNGGSGNNAGKPQGVTAADGGNAGNGGNVAGGGVFVNSGAATLVNDTILNNQATTVGLPGSAGFGVGNGISGNLGSNGTASGGGYFAASGSTGNVGNTILDLNAVAAGGSGGDVFGTFQSQGNNILGSTTGATGFGASDQSGITAAQLNLGPLLNNGGPTLTEALLNNSSGKSAAIDSGNSTLVTSTYSALFGSNPTDQRGVGFPRIYGSAVDVGAFEYQPPVITKLSPNSAVEQSGSFQMVITGTGFASGATVSFGGASLTPSNTTLNQITVNVPGPMPDEDASPISITVSNPDGSGVAGETVTSAAVPFLITEDSTLTVSNPGKQTSSEGQSITSLAITTGDPDTTYSAAGLPPGLKINSTTGVISGTIDPYSAGTYNVTITATDGAVTGQAKFTWIVNDTTPPSFTNPGNLTNDEGYTIPSPGLATKPVDADKGSISASNLPPGLKIDSTTGLITGTIDPRGAGTYNVVISATDGTVTGTTKFTWTVNDTTPPSFTNPGNQTNNEGYTIPNSGLATDPVDADPGSITATGLPPGLSIDSTTGVITGTIDPYGAGNYNVTISATDGTVTGQIKFSWTVKDTTAPSFTNPGNLTNDEGYAIPSPGLATDPVDADPGSITATGLPPGLKIDSTTGLITGTIDPRGAGTYNVVISATDGTVTGTTKFTWTVKDTTPPGFTNPGNLTNNEGDKVSVKLNPVDADPASITATGLPTGLSIDSTTGVISGTIDKYGAGNYTVTISATDGTVTGQTSFIWTVKDTTPPSFTNPGNLTNNEGDQVKSLATSPVDADPGSITATGLPPGLSIDSTTGVITGTIDPRGAGTYNVTISATDGALTNQIKFTWTVKDTTPPSFTIVPITLLSNEGDTIDQALDPVDADPGSITATGLPPGLSIDSTTGVISGTIDKYGAGTYNVAVNATDGTVKGKMTFTWTVNDTTPPSFTNPGNLTNNEGDQVKSLATSPVDADPGSITATGLPPGLKIDSTTGVISGTIDKYGAGTYNVTISATDGTIVGQTKFTWTVNDTTPPSFSNLGNQTNNEGDQVTGIALNPVDADSGSITVSGLPTGLSFNPSTNVISGTIDSRAGGTYTVTVSATDGKLIGKTTFTWTVNETTPPSLTNPGNQISNEGNPVYLALTPVDADPGSITAADLPPGLSINSTIGVISGTINPYVAGAYPVTVSAADGKLSSSVTFIWTVNDTTPPALANPGKQTSNGGVGISLPINAVDADPGSFSASGLPGGLSINPYNGLISGTTSGSPGNYSVTVSASDGGIAGSVTFPWVVNQMPTQAAFATIHTNYVGLFQLETITALVTDPAGVPVSQGVVTFQVNGQSITAPVANGFAMATIQTPLLSLDLTTLMSDFFQHALDALYSDPNGIFGSTSISVTEPPLLLDFLLFLLSEQPLQLMQTMGQLQSV